MAVCDWLDVCSRVRTLWASCFGICRRFFSLVVSLLYCHCVLYMVLYIFFHALYVPSRFPPCRRFVVMSFFIPSINYAPSSKFTPDPTHTAGIHAFLVSHIYLPIAISSWLWSHDHSSSISSSTHVPCDIASFKLLGDDRIETPMSSSRFSDLNVYVQADKASQRFQSY